MKAQLALEHIGSHKYETIQRMNRGKETLTPTRVRDLGVGTFHTMPWVAEITGTGRQLLRWNKDVSRANNAFTRGVYLWFILESGRLYEVFEMLSWTRTNKYWCVVTPEGDLKKLSFEEKNKWLSDH